MAVKKVTEESKEIEKTGVHSVDSQDGEDIETEITGNISAEETSVQENQNRAPEDSEEQEENIILEVKTVQKDEENANYEMEVQLGDNTSVEFAKGEDAVGQEIISEDGTPGEDGNKGFPGGDGRTGENGENGLNGINGTGSNLALPSEGLINIDMPGISVNIDLSKLNNTLRNLRNKRNR